MRFFAPFLVLALVAAARAVDYTFVTIDVPGAATTSVLDINDKGQVTGFSVTDTSFGPLYNAFTANADGTGFMLLDRPGAVGLGASGINSNGEISGVSVAFPITATGFVRNKDGTSYADIDPSTGGLKSAYAEAVDLNDNGMVVGFYTEDQPLDEQDASVHSHGYIYDNGVYTTLDHPGGHGTQLYSVNNAGTISGRYLDANEVSHGFHYRAGTGFEDLVIPGFDPALGLGTEGEGLNNDGDFTAVGYVPLNGDPNGLPFSFIHTGGAYIPFEVPGAAATVAYSLNDRGQIVGLYAVFDPTGNLVFHGFAATPVPEPATLAVLGLGLVALRRRRRV